MRKAEFHVPADVIAEFAEELENRDLENLISGTNEDNEIIIEVSYEKDQTKQVDELEEILDSLIENINDDEEDEE